MAASADNAVVPYYLDADLDGLARPWFGVGQARVVPVHREGYGADQDCCTPLCSQTVWCNPGFSGMERWVQKAIAEVGREPRSTAVLVGLVAPSTAWWRAAVAAGAEIRLLSPRVQFVAPPGIKQTSNPRESALFIFRSPPIGSLRPAHIWTWRWKED